MVMRLSSARPSSTLMSIFVRPSSVSSSSAPRMNVPKTPPARLKASIWDAYVRTMDGRAELPTPVLSASVAVT